MADSSLSPYPLLYCSPRHLGTPYGLAVEPIHLRIEAAERARQENPANAPLSHQLFRLAQSLCTTMGVPFHDVDARDILKPEHIAMITTKWWGQTRTHTVGFKETTGPDLQRKIVAYANKWAQDQGNIPGAGIQFVLHTGSSWQDADLRISRAPGGYYSYIGTDNASIPANENTMNLEMFTLKTPDSEFDRVVCHEVGHYLGCPHEHQRAAIVARLNREAVIQSFMSSQGWSRQEVIDQILTPLDERSLMGTPADVTSIMAYQIPPSLTIDGQGVAGGTMINPSDLGFMASVYPRGNTPPGPTTPAPQTTVPPQTTTPPSTTVPPGQHQYRISVQSDSPLYVLRE